MKKFQLFLFGIIIVTMITNCHKDESKRDPITYFSDSGSFIDSRDSTHYKWVHIGNQVWMAENLKYLSSDVNAYVPNYYDPSYPSSLEYIKNIPKAKASENYKTYGCLYRVSSNICPDGWHIPSSNEWLELINYVGGLETAGGILKEFGTAHWNNPNTGAVNKSLFTALPAGEIINKYYADNYGINTYCFFWSSDGYIIRIKNDNAGILNFGKAGYPEDTWGFLSIRCIKN